jgi:hypothetical protein
VSSNPPPSQLRTLIGGTCNASGNLTLKSIVPSRSFYSVFTAILKVTAGAPQWEIDLLGVPVGIGGGGVVVMGAIYANPGESFTLIVSGAAPNAVVSGGLYGFLSDSPETLPQLGVSSGGVAASGGGGALPSGQSRVDGSLTNVGDTISIAVGGSAAVGFESPTVFLSGTTLALEGTTDDVGWIGSSLYWLSGWYSADPFPPAGFGYSGAQPVQIPAAGLSQVRARLKTLGGGQTLPIAVTLRATPGGTLAWPVGARAAAQSLGVVLATDQPAIAALPTYKNRVEFAATALTIATVAAEAMLTLVPVRAGVAGAGVTTIPVTAGKRLRLHSMLGEFRNNAAAAHVDQFTLKTNPTGAVVVGSPSLARIELYSTAALANTGEQQSVSFADGIEFAGTEQIGISHLSDAAAIGFGTVSLIGIEYTP